MKEIDVEPIAELAHNIWSTWARYLFSKSKLLSDITSNCKINSMEMIIPDEITKRWKKQMNTPYNELSEKEKDSDRKIAIEFIKVVRKQLKNQLEEVIIVERN